MAAEGRRGQMSAWLQKKKSGSAIVRVRQYNKRFFTLDFDSHVFFYTHTENSKKVSCAIPFADLLDVKSNLEQRSSEISETNSESSRSSKTSFLRRRLTKEFDQEHIVTLMTKPARLMELVCSSPSEAVQWFEALKEAMAMAGAGGDAAVPSAVSEVAAPSESLGNSSAAAPAALGPTSGGYPVAGSSVAGRPPVAPNRPPLAPRPAAEEAAGQKEAETNLPVDAAKAEEEPVQAPAKGTFLDFSTALEATPDEASGLGAATAVKVEEATTVVTTSATSLQASDFGFGADDQSSSDDEAKSSANSSPVTTPRATPACSSTAGRLATESKLAGSPAPLGGPASVVAHLVDDKGERPPAYSPGVPAKRNSDYGDRHQGQTLAERLANMEFSDDEDDDDDDPLGLKSKAS